MNIPEPWLRGYLSDLHPVIAAVLYALQQAREDLEKWTENMNYEQLWYLKDNIAPLGFQIRHTAGSIDRLTTYAFGEQLSEAQLTELQHETDRDLTREQLLEMLERALQRAEALARAASPEQFGDRREIGRKRIRTTLGGLLIHIAEHTQRHVGEAIVTAKLARQA